MQPQPLYTATPPVDWPPLASVAVDILELPHHGQWSEESVDLVARCGAAVLVQSTNMARHARDRWKDIPADRLVTYVDGTTTTHIDDTGAIHVSAPHLPRGTIRP